MSVPLNEISKKVCQFIERPIPDDFESLAIEVFTFQFHHNRPYQNLCLRNSRTPDTVTEWKEIPAVPAAAFKEFRLSCLSDQDTPEAIFITSGTTLGNSKKGRHLIAKLSVYESAILPNFEKHLLPDYPSDTKPLKMMILTGSPLDWPNSSLAHMMETVKKRFGAPGSAYYISEKGLESDRLIRDLQAAQLNQEPVFLLGISLAFHQLIEHMDAMGISLKLAPLSRIMDTGGFKAQKPHVSRRERIDRLQKTLGISPHTIVNEYGMTELGSQFYENTFSNRVAGKKLPRFMTIPPWVRIEVVDPENLKITPPHQVGMLKVLDLANCGSVSSIITEDLGMITEDGFKLSGRIHGSEARGCSLMIEDLRDQ